MKSIKTFCPFCQKETHTRAVITAQINKKVYFIVNCEKCKRGSNSCYKISHEIWNTDFKLEQAVKLI